MTQQQQQHTCEVTQTHIMSPFSFSLSLSLSLSGPILASYSEAYS